MVDHRTVCTTSLEVLNVLIIVELKSALCCLVTTKKMLNYLRGGGFGEHVQTPCIRKLKEDAIYQRAWVTNVYQRGRLFLRSDTFWSKRRKE